MNTRNVLDSKLRYRNLSDLIEPPVIIRVNSFNEQSLAAFSESFSRAHNTGQDIIPIVIDSHGGHVDALFGIVDQINSSDKIIATIVEGKAASCGAVLLTCGTVGHRYVGKNAYVMIHEVRDSISGKIDEIKVTAEHALYENKAIFDLLANNCGHRPSYFRDIIHDRNHADWYLNAEDCLKHNIANVIGIPELITKISVDFELKMK